MMRYKGGLPPLMIYECISRRRRVIHSMICQACGLDKSRSDLGRLAARSCPRPAPGEQAPRSSGGAIEYFLKHSRNARKSQICFISFCFSYILEKTMIHRFFFGDPAPRLCRRRVGSAAYSPATRMKKATLLGGSFVCAKATKKIFFAFCNKVSNSHGLLY